MYEHIARLKRTRNKTVYPEGIVTIDGFLGERDCRIALEELEVAVWRPSMVYVQHDDGQYRDIFSPLRVSETAQQRWFSDPMQRILDRVERRLGRLFGVEPAYLESWQATTYPFRGKFYYHLDAGYWEGHHAGDRILTFLLYLTTPARGGGTHFRALDTYVEARAGRLLVWDNLFPDGGANHRMIHSSVPLLGGKKTTLITWQRQERYRSWQEQGQGHAPEQSPVPRRRRSGSSPTSARASGR
jgi:prolyl 4-hydroxylase